MIIFCHKYSNSKLRVVFMSHALTLIFDVIKGGKQFALICVSRYPLGHG